MKISSHQFVKAALVGAGLLAVLLAWRADDGNESRSAFSTAGSDIQFGQMDTGMAADKLQQLDAEADSQSSPYPGTGYTVDFVTSAEATDSVRPEVAFSTPDQELQSNPQDDSLQIKAIRMDDLLEVELDSAMETDFDLAGEATTVDFVESVPAKPVTTSINPVLGEAAAQKAVHHIEYGKSLARRSASEAASQEFLGALRVLAESYDQSTGGNTYSSSLRRGLLAIREAEDFKFEDPNRQIAVNVAGVIEAHETGVIGPDEAETITASAAMRRYLEFAGQMLGTCGGQNVVAAEALYCLGKMRTMATQSRPDPESLKLYEAIIFHHASLIADPRNYRSANELGVLLARSGQLEAAEIHLKNSLKINPMPQTWANLAKVHHRKGSAADQRLANLAINEFQLAMQHQVPATSGPFRWVHPQEFDARSPIQSPNMSFSGTNTVVPASNEVEDNRPSFVERIGSLLPFSRR